MDRSLQHRRWDCLGPGSGSRGRMTEGRALPSETLLRSWRKWSLVQSVSLLHKHIIYQTWQCRPTRNTHVLQVHTHTQTIAYILHSSSRKGSWGENMGWQSYAVWLLMSYLHTDMQVTFSLCSELCHSCSDSLVIPVSGWKMGLQLKAQLDAEQRNDCPTWATLCFKLAHCYICIIHEL